MGSDRARRSYDPSRMYRSVVSQQGRVTLEADANEAEEIRADESRAELVDIIGPVGAPDDGFKITVPGAGLAPFDFAIGQGTIFVGGVRVHQDDANATYLGQATTEWLGGAPLPDRANKIPFTEAVYLAVTEQEVCAVEDEALREVALGGPDTAARTRLIQRVQRWPVKTLDCEEAFAFMRKEVYESGASFDRTTMRLIPRIRLGVGFVDDSSGGDTCQPQAQSGFLGPENQLIRVQVSTPDESGAETMLWGWDNASFLYRVVPRTDLKTLELQGIPVDVHHHPAVNQWVELLDAAVDLGGNAWMAAPGGTPLQVEAYDAGRRTVTLKGEFRKDVLARPSPLFMRVWESRITIPANEKPVELIASNDTSTGVRVYVYTKGTRPVAGDYWTIGVRPNTPQVILPARLKEPQPPDGPKRWVAPLAVVSWRKDLSADVTDCRPPFLNLVELTRRKPAKCCELVVSPEDHASKTLTLQDAINTVVKAGGGTICLEAGVYELDKTLEVKGATSVRITGKGPRSWLRADLALMPTDTLAALTVSGSTFVTLDAFRVQGTGGTGASVVVVDNSTQVCIERLQVNGSDDWTGIALRGALGDITIRENQITAYEGIVDLLDQKIGATGLTDLRVENNLLQCTAAGVRLENVSIHLGVSRFVGNRVFGCQDAGFKLLGATVPGCTVEVIGNNVEVIGSGILTGLDGVRIADNDLRPPVDPKKPEVDPKKDRNIRAKLGIALTKGSAPQATDDAQITGNRITRFAIGIRAEVPLGSVSVARNQISTCGTGVEIMPEAMVNLIVDGNQIGDIDATAISIVSGTGRITVSDNHLEVIGEGPIVSITCRNGDCLFCQNHCAAPKTDATTVHLDCRTVALTSNRIEGSVALACQLSKLAKVVLCTVLGNVSGAITINKTIPLANTHWDALNVPNL